MAFRRGQRKLRNSPQPAVHGDEPSSPGASHHPLPEGYRIHISRYGTDNFNELETKSRANRVTWNSASDMDWLSGTIWQPIDNIVKVRYVDE